MENKKTDLLGLAQQLSQKLVEAQHAQSERMEKLISRAKHLKEKIQNFKNKKK